MYTKTKSQMIKMQEKLYWGYKFKQGGGAKQWINNYKSWALKKCWCYNKKINVVYIKFKQKNYIQSTRYQMCVIYDVILPNKCIIYQISQKNKSHKMNLGVTTQLQM